MVDSGLDTIQLWVVWAWVEAKPDEFRFDDYDRLVALADKHGLNVVLSTIAAIHPYWIHRVVPGSEMVDNFGHRVVSSNRGEVHFGLTPGGCFDHPGVWERMKQFLTATVTHYHTTGNLLGWDAWNELRWNVRLMAWSATATTRSTVTGRGWRASMVGSRASMRRGSGATRRGMTCVPGRRRTGPIRR